MPSVINFVALEGFNGVIVVLYFLNKIIADKIIIKPLIIIKDPKTISFLISIAGKIFFVYLIKKPNVNATKGGGNLVFISNLIKIIYPLS